MSPDKDLNLRPTRRALLMTGAAATAAGALGGWANPLSHRKESQKRRPSDRRFMTTL